MEQTFFPNHKPMVSALFHSVYLHDLEQTQVFSFLVHLNGGGGLRGFLLAAEALRKNRGVSWECLAFLRKEASLQVKF